MQGAVPILSLIHIYFIGVDQFQGETIANYTGLVFNEDKEMCIRDSLSSTVVQTN